jgi:hypothetical protein
MRNDHNISSDGDRDEDRINYLLDEREDEVGNQGMDG